MKHVQVDGQDAQPVVAADVAFEQDVLALRPALTAFARRLNRQRSDVEDLVQDTIARAIAYRHRFEPGTNLKSWMFTIMRNRFTTAYHRYQREAPHGEAVIEARSGSAPAQGSALWANEAMRELVDGIPSNHREIIILIPVLGLSYEDAAEICGCTMGTVKSRLNRARAALEARCGTPSD